jgi:hypothetical protein
MNVSTDKQLCSLSLRNAQRQNFSKSFVCRYSQLAAQLKFDQTRGKEYQEKSAT